jgi:hypothetical protein
MISEKPFFCIVLGDDDQWMIEAERPDGLSSASWHSRLVPTPSNGPSLSQKLGLSNELRPALDEIRLAASNTR